MADEDRKLVVRNALTSMGAEGFPSYAWPTLLRGELGSTADSDARILNAGSMEKVLFRK